MVGGSEFSNVRFRGDEQKAAAVYENANPLLPQDIAETVARIAAFPPRMNVNSIEIMPTSQAFAPFSVYKDKDGR